MYYVCIVFDGEYKTFNHQCCCLTVIHMSINETKFTNGSSWHLTERALNSVALTAFYFVFVKSRGNTMDALHKQQDTDADTDIINAALQIRMRIYTVAVCTNANTLAVQLPAGIFACHRFCTVLLSRTNFCTHVELFLRLWSL